MDHNSVVNQNIKGQFVKREVFVCATSLVEYVLGREDRDAPFSMDDIENLYRYPEWSEKVVGEDLYFPGGTEEERDEFAENFDRLIDESQELLDSEEIGEGTHERNVDIIERAKSEFEDATEDSEPQEIFEWWIVSSWLADKLKAKGEAVISDGMNSYWGRGCSGQAILLDSVISQICEDLGMLKEDSVEQDA